MKISANTVYEAAMGLMGLINSDGKPSGAADSMRKNAPACFNAVIAEVSGYNEAITGNPITPGRIVSLNDEIECDLYLVNTVLPAALARRLAVRMDPELATYFKAEYYESLTNLKNRYKAKNDGILEV
ncbi:MAG: hypothetical protein PHW77_08995, partial [Eubacteriales bacterium]|nr:hypothetical protein [Eubacteriales bacterium]